MAFLRESEIIVDGEVVAWMGAFEGKKALLPNLEQRSQPVYVDFCAGPLDHMRRFGLSKNDLLPRALGVRHGYKKVIDATAGLGADAFMMACLGFKVIALERSPVLFALLVDAQTRASENEQVKEILDQRLQFENQDALLYFDQIQVKDNVYPDVVYLDPMFPASEKSALAKKEMRLLQRLLPYDFREGGVLLSKAMKVAKERVVVKRPVRAGFLDERKPSHSFKGKAVRYDMYLVQEGFQ